MKKCSPFSVKASTTRTKVRECFLGLDLLCFLRKLCPSFSLSLSVTFVYGASVDLKICCETQHNTRETKQKLRLHRQTHAHRGHTHKYSIYSRYRAVIDGASFRLLCPKSLLILLPCPAWAACVFSGLCNS